MREAFEKWYFNNESSLTRKEELFKTDSLGYVDEIVWKCFEAWKTAWEMSKNDNH